MKYLVTGATGLLGNNIVRLLAATGEMVRVLARDESDPRALADLPVERASGDVRDATAVTAACKGVDVVIHSAGHVRIGWSQGEVQRQINVEGTRHVASAARAAGARMVHVSSVDALGLGRRKQPGDEEKSFPGIVECPYVVTKREAERVVLEEVDRGLWASIVNPGIFFGPWDWKPSSGKMMLAVARYMLFAPTGAGSFCDVRDVAAGTIAAAARGKSGRRYVLGGHNLSYRQGCHEMARVTSQRAPWIPMGPIFSAFAYPVLGVRSLLRRPEGEANAAMLAMSRQDHCFKSDRAQEELGYQIRPLRQTFEDTWQWFRDHGYAPNNGR